MEDEIIPYSKSRILKLEVLLLTLFESRARFEKYSYDETIADMLEFCKDLLQDFKEGQEEG